MKMAKNTNVCDYADLVTLNADSKINLSNVEAVHVLARRWFQKLYGNTYFSLSVDVEIAGKLVEVVNVPFTYGYGDHFDTVALEEFSKVINMEGKEFSEYSYLSRFCRDNNIPVYSNAVDVKRKKDM
ncbi:hypothetical protein A71_240 [Escherichia phage A7_1]|nr:hypothetical protein A71_240 [Escherichia phage A7_1]